MNKDNKFQEYTDSILKKSERDIDDLIDASIKKSRFRKRKIQLTVIFSSFILIFASLTLFLNYNDDFYTYALENDYLKSLAETLRFKDIYTDAPKESLGNDDFDISVSKPIHKEIIDVEKLSFKMPNSEDSWFSYSHSDQENHYFVELKHSEAMYDPIIAIWKFNSNQEMIKLLDLEKEELRDFAETLESFSELDGTLYLANNEDDYTRVYRLDNDKRILIDESLRHNFYNTNTYVMFARNSDNLWYSRLNKTEKGYCYTVKNVKNDKELKIDCFKEELDPHLIPIMQLSAINEKYIVFRSHTTSFMNWEKNPRDVELSSEIKVYDRRGKLLDTYNDANALELIGDVLILQKEIEETYKYELIDLLKGYREEIPDASKLYYNLKDRGIPVFAFSGTERWFDGTKVSGPSFRTSAVRFQTTADTIENQYLVFNYVENPVIIFEDNNNQVIYFYKLVFK